MAEHGLAGIRLRRRVRTTVPEPSDQKVPDLLKRDFTAETQHQVRRRHHVLAVRRRSQPLPGHRDRLLLAQARRLGGRRPHAHQPGHRCPQGCPGRPGLAARGDLPRRPRPGLHLQGLRPALRPARRDPSHGAVGTSADNALAESFNATLKRETLAGAATYSDESPCRREIFHWAVRYNTRRRHSYSGRCPRTPTRTSSWLPSRKPRNPTHPVSKDRGQGPTT